MHDGRQGDPSFRPHSQGEYLGNEYPPHYQGGEGPRRTVVQSGPSSDQRWMPGGFPSHGGMYGGGMRESVSAPGGDFGGELRLLRPGAAMEAGFLEVYPRFGKKKPYLLEQLELFLEEKVRNSGTPPELNIYTQHLMGEYIRNNPLSAQHNACSLKLVRCTRKGFAVIVFTRCFSHIVGSVA
eukprot:626027-Prorocentrum_minimum.AAC.2